MHPGGSATYTICVLLRGFRHGPGTHRERSLLSRTADRELVAVEACYATSRDEVALLLHYPHALIVRRGAGSIASPLRRLGLTVLLPDSTATPARPRIDLTHHGIRVQITPDPTERAPLILRVLTRLDDAIELDESIELDPADELDEADVVLLAELPPPRAVASARLPRARAIFEAPPTRLPRGTAAHASPGEPDGDTTRPGRAPAGLRATTELALRDLVRVREDDTVDDNEPTTVDELPTWRDVPGLPSWGRK